LVALLQLVRRLRGTVPTVSTRAEIENAFLTFHLLEKRNACGMAPAMTLDETHAIQSAMRGEAIDSVQLAGFFGTTPARARCLLLVVAEPDALLLVQLVARLNRRQAEPSVLYRALTDVEALRDMAEARHLPPPSEAL